MLRASILLLAVQSLLFASSSLAQDNEQGDIIYPTPNTVWKVGQLVNVTFRETVPPQETVDIFFANDRTDTLGSGPMTQHVFPFVVPAGAISPDDGTSLLLAVRRVNFYLNTVDAVNVRVVP